MIHDRRHALARLLAHIVQAVLPRHLKVAEDYMRAHLDSAITNEQLAELSGISLRTLQYRLKEYGMV